MIYADLDFSDPWTQPKLKLGTKAQFTGSQSVYTVVKVSPKGGTAVLRRDADGKETKVKRARVSRRSIPPELGLCDVSPRYYDHRRRQVR